LGKIGTFVILIWNIKKYVNLINILLQEEN